MNRSLMKLIARQTIVGITSDEGLYALDGIKLFEADLDTPDELIDRFEEGNSAFCAVSYEIINPCQFRNFK